MAEIPSELQDIDAADRCWWGGREGSGDRRGRAIVNEEDVWGEALAPAYSVDVADKEAGRVPVIIDGDEDED